MIEIKELRKSYKTGDFVQKALDGVSLNFRDNEFVAILGTSGSGKTTLLNIIGGLDHADSGDIVINGVSTCEYKAKDWNTYRNHHVGFVFQSYNLIPHQTILSNVELALTLSGVGRSERKKRAKEALEKVGLGEHINKKPSQLSGGQAQRVAIARALVNDPDIVLADEPTGALDTETGIQVMNILKEVANDRLVVMVTHNPALADEYASRIVKLKDGQIIDDSLPYNPTEEEIQQHVASNTASERKAGMNFLTALGLSFSNLMTKKGRTFMTAFAGSIGIIGIASILSLSNGVNNYIAATEEEALTSYPLTITKSSFDLSTLMSGLMGYGETDTGSESSNKEHGNDDPIPETAIMTDMFAQVKNNDLKAFKTYLDNSPEIGQYVNTIRYRYDITPQIYQYPLEDKPPVQLNPSKAGSSFSNGLMGSAFSLSTSTTDSFTEMIDDPDMIQHQMQLVDGRWAENYDECLLVLNNAGEISDYTLYSIGIKDISVMEDIFKQVLRGEEADIPESEESNFTYADALNTTFKVVPRCALYKHNEESQLWSDISGDSDELSKRVEDGITLKIVGIIKPADDFTGNPMSEGIAYTHDLTLHLMDMASTSDIVMQQKADPDRDVFTGKTFEELQDEENSGFDMGEMFKVDEEALQHAFSMDTSAFDFSSMNMDLSQMDFDMNSSGWDSSDINIDNSVLSGIFDEASIRAIFANAPAFELSDLDLGNTELSPEQRQAVNELADKLSASFGAWMLVNGKAFPQSGAEYTDLFSEYLADPNSGADAILDEVKATFGADIEAKLTNSFNTYMERKFIPYLSNAMSSLMENAAAAIANQMAIMMTDQISAATNSIGSSLSNAISGELMSQMYQISDALENGFSFDAEAFADAIQINMSQEDLTNLLNSYLNSEDISYEANLTKLGYAEESDPQSISLYPKDFKAKEEVLTLIDDYNSEQEAIGNDEGAIQYSDIAGVLMSSVTSIVDAISFVLIAFVSISLVVSSIMIGIITYISVLERKKEIGILRAMGASAGNVANVFNAETFIEGLISGVLAIAVVVAASFPVNALVYAGFDVPNVMTLPVDAAIVLILISVILTFIAGVIPSQSASHRDPVEALRSE